MTCKECGRDIEEGNLQEYECETCKAGPLCGSCYEDGHADTECAEEEEEEDDDAV